MPIWNGETWLCTKCQFVNAVLRKRCRNCGAACPAADEPHWRCFWLDDQDKGVSADDAAPALLSEVIERMREVIPGSQKSFVGVVDRLDGVMQFALQASGWVVMDIPVPKRGGSWYVELDLEECCRRVEALRDRQQISVADYPDMKFRIWDLRLPVTS